MTLMKGNKLFKLGTYAPRDGSTVVTRMENWLGLHAGETEISDRDLGEILCPNEAYVVHEVMSDVHYAGHEEGFSFAPSVDLKVLH